MPEKSKPRYAHRTILAAASPYFNAMFTSDFVEAVDAKRQQVRTEQGFTLNIQMYLQSKKFNSCNVFFINRLPSKDLVDKHLTVYFISYTPAE